MKGTITARMFGMVTGMSSTLVRRLARDGYLEVERRDSPDRNGYHYYFSEKELNRVMGIKREHENISNYDLGKVLRGGEKESRYHRSGKEENMVTTDTKETVTWEKALQVILEMMPENIRGEVETSLTNVKKPPAKDPRDELVYRVLTTDIEDDEIIKRLNGGGTSTKAIRLQAYGISRILGMEEPYRTQTVEWLMMKVCK
jgi:hypothetical protein